MTEQELKEAIASACEMDYERAMAAPKHHFSRKFRKKMKIMLQPENGKRTIPVLYPVHGRRRIIIVVAVLVLLLGTTVMGRGFFQSILGKHVLTNYTDHVQLDLPKAEVEENNLEQLTVEEVADTEEDFVFVCRKPQWVPEGYELESEEYDETLFLYSVNYIDKQGKLLLYQQIRIGAVDNFGMSSNGEELQKIKVASYDGYFVPDDMENKERGNVIWADGKYIYTIEGFLSKNDLMKMAELVKK